jgi:hypothetical protein
MRLTQFTLSLVKVSTRALVTLDLLSKRLNMLCSMGRILEAF